MKYYRYYLLLSVTLTKLTNCYSLVMPLVPQSLDSNISVVIIDTTTKRTIYVHNNNTPRLIASNVKIFTSLFGLKYLGPDFRWHTKIKYTGTITKHTLYGDLFFQGGGDPSLDTQAIYYIVSNLKRLGIHTIKGNIIFDNSIFNHLTTYSMLETTNYDPDQILPNGLIINRNEISINLNPYDLTINSNLYKINLINKLHFTSQNTVCDLDHSIKLNYNNSNLTLNGVVNPRCMHNPLRYFILEPFTYNQMLISQIFDDFYIKTTGNYLTANTPSTARLIYDYSSPNLKHILIDMNIYSYNLYAATILLSVGAYETDNKNTFNNARELYLGFLTKYHFLDNNFKLENAAGLSRHEYFTAQSIARLLLIINNSPFGTIIEASLPTPQNDGTLDTSFIPWATRLHAKTGSLNDTQAYSGYFYSKNGRKYIVSLIANNLKNTSQRAIFNQFCAQIFTALDK